MKKSPFLIFSAFVIAAVCSCEEVIPIYDERPKMLVINALASTDTTLAVSVSSAYASNSMHYVAPYLDEDFTWYVRLVDSAYVRECVIDSATVHLRVNGNDYGTLAYDPANLVYKSEYRPAVGDDIELSAECVGLKTARSSAIVPIPQRLEVLSIDKYYTKKESDDQRLSDSDTIVEVRLRITDPPGQRNYYRLKVRHVISYYIGDKMFMHAGDVFFSDDPIFRDERLVSAYGGWSSMFSPVFDDSLFDGEQREFTVVTRRMKNGVKLSDLSIELQSLSHDYYNYIKSCQLYRVTRQTDFTEILPIVSNVNGGYGMFGAVATENHFVKL